MLQSLLWLCLNEYKADRITSTTHSFYSVFIRGELMLQPAPYSRDAVIPARVVVLSNMSNIAYEKVYKETKSKE